MQRSPGLPVVRAVLADVTGGDLRVLACRHGRDLVLRLADRGLTVARARAAADAGPRLELPYAGIEGARGHAPRSLLGHGLVLVDAGDVEDGREGAARVATRGAGRRLSLALTVPRGVDAERLAHEVAAAARGASVR